MAFVPSVVSTQEDGKDRLVKPNFLNGTNHLISPVQESSCARTDGGIYFGQKPELSTNCHKNDFEASVKKKS